MHSVLLLDATVTIPYPVLLYCSVMSLTADAVCYGHWVLDPAERRKADCDLCDHAKQEGTELSVLQRYLELALYGFFMKSLCRH